MNIPSRTTFSSTSTLQEVERVLVASLADILDVEEQAIKVDETFSDMGVDSIVAVQWTRALNARHKISMLPTKLFDYPSVQSLAAFVLELLGQRPSTAAGTTNVLQENYPAKAPIPAPQSAAEAADSTVRTQRWREEPIAIVGMSGQFPMARTIAEFWANLAAGRDCVSEIPSHRWALDGFYAAGRPKTGRSYSKWMGVLADVDKFDPAFFSVSPVDAEWMDPQQRLFLQQSWRGLEDAGLDASSLSGMRCGVFVGCARVDYGTSGPGQTNTSRLLGSSMAMLSARVAYYLNLKGPCMSIDTASSSSLVAIAQACDSLVLGQSDLVLAGGASVITGPALHVASCDAGMLSPQGRCFTFDQRADGFVPAEAIGVLVLKRLSDALRDGHHIYGLIRGWSVNHDGKTNGITAPSAASQAQLQREVYERFGIDPASISVIEAHGTGTKLGDPIEVEALTQSFKFFTAKENYCALGSAKSSIGHALGAAGVVGVIKAALMLKHRAIPATVHFEHLNEHITLEHTPFFVNRELRPWEPAADAPRRVAVNAFGLGGTNAHVVLEEYVPHSVDQREPSSSNEIPNLIVLSARNEERLGIQAAQLLEVMHSGAFRDADLPNIAYTLQTGRQGMKSRLALIVYSIQDLTGKLEMYVEGTPAIENVYRGEVKRDQDGLALLATDESVAEMIDTWIHKRKYDRLLELWTKGVAIPWRRLYGEQCPTRVSLPTYPFSQERYWIPEPDIANQEPQSSQSCPALDGRGGPVIHPLLHQNTSTLEGLRFTSNFSGKEFAHMLQATERECSVPPAVLLEMARAAVAQISETTGQICLSEVGFAAPLFIEEPGQVHIRLWEEDENDLSYEIYTEKGGEITVHSHGRASTAPEPVAKIVDLAALRAQCSSSVSSLELQNLLSAAGHKNGPHSLCMESIHFGMNDGDERFALASTNFISDTGQGGPQAGIHSGVLTAVMLAQRLNNQPEAIASLRPQALKELVFTAQLPSKATAVARAVGGRTNDAAPFTCDIDLCDENGVVCAQIKGLAFDTPDLEATAIEPALSDSSDAAIETAKNREDTAGLLDKVQNALLHAITKVLRMKLQDIDLDAQLHEFGFDSISLVAFSNVLNEAFNLELIPTVFFEFPTIRRLSDYLIHAHGAVLAESLKTSQPSAHRTALQTAASNVQPRNARVTQKQRRPLDRRRKRMSRSEADPIAVIGMSGRFAQADDIHKLWQILKEGRDCIREIPVKRWAGLFSEDLIREVSKGGTRWGGYMDGIEEFDPLFFGISPREAEIMDPQQRLIMTYVWKAIEDAGYAPRSLSGTRTALFIGLSASGYDKLVAKAGGPIEGFTAAAFLPSVAPNRVSHFLDLRGPSEPIETACSSSLLAVHRAIMALRNEQCEMAIAGGVNIILNLDRHIGLGKAGMLSPDGRCHTFSSAANGYVRGEGVGMVLLKKLSAAERDGDHIYAVVRGSAENHGGRSSSLTAPNPTAQAEVVKAAWLAAGVDPRTITYIEAHGTGTQLGDPIETKALKSAFEELESLFPDSSGEPARCGLGSLKTNIGHLEMAAGIAGFIKVVLQLKHKTLAKSLHCKEINPYIQLKGSPLYVVQENQTWSAVPGRGGVELPRRAGVSSFGFGGVNAHVVLEEYQVPQRSVRTSENATKREEIVLLSAATEEQLKEQARQLLDAIAREGLTDADLPGLAYTLQTGRESMEHRLATTAASMAQLQCKLQGFLDNNADVSDLYTGECRRNKDALSIFAGDPDMAAVVDGWIRNGRHTRAMELWVKGLRCDWMRLYGENRPQRMSLPTYPFLRDRYWVSADKAGGIHGPERNSTGSVLHPLVHANASSFSGVRFKSRFTGAEPFISDHQVNGAKILAAAVYLEMARAAVEQSLFGNAKTDFQAIQIRNVIWLRPLTISETPVEVTIVLHSKDQAVDFEIATAGDVIHSRGSAQLQSLTESAVLDIQTVRARCTQLELRRADCYDAFQGRGLNYGPTYQGIEELYVGNDEALARIRLPQICKDDRLTLHPAFIDSALQAAIGLNLARDNGKPERPAVMFSMQSVEVLDKTPESGWAWVRANAGPTDASDSLDVDIMDDNGRVCIRLQGASRRRPADRASIESSSNTEPPPLTLVPVWEPVLNASTATFTENAAAVVLLGGNEQQREAIKTRFANARLLPISIDDTVEDLSERFATIGDIGHVVLSLSGDATDEAIGAGTIYDSQHHAVLTCFRVIKALLNLGYEERALAFTVLTVDAEAISSNEDVNPAHAAVHGLIGSLAKEQKNWQVRLIDITINSEAAITDLMRISADPDGLPLFYRAGMWYRQRLASARVPNPVSPAFARAGVYVVIGGAGGVGVAFTEYLIRRYQAQVIWLGRRPEDDEIRASIRRLVELGPAPSYLQCDAADPEALEHAYSAIKRRHSRIHGIIHAAVVIDGADLAHIDEQRFAAAMSAKIAVCTQLARIFAQEPLDTILFFSSIQSFERMPRHSYYAAGCTFTDAFARMLAKQWSSRVRVMNWGYWRDTRQEPLPPSFQNWLKEAGMGTIAPNEGFAALETLVAGPFGQLVFLRTIRPDAMQGVEIVSDEIFAAQESTPTVAQCLNVFQPKELTAENADDTTAGRAELLALLRGILLAQLQMVGLFAEGGPSLVNWKKVLGVPPLYDRWLKEAIHLLAGEGGISVPENGDAFPVAFPDKRKSAWRAWDEYKHSSTDEYHTARVNLIETMVRALPEILCGSRLATDVMFPKGKLTLVEPLYTTSRLSSYFNEVLANAVIAYVEARRSENPGVRLRLLEIGAGTGATSGVVFRKLMPYHGNIAEYCYTDISPVFLTHAETAFGATAPYLRVQLLDISSPIVAQGITPGTYDLVIAANVLHATRDMHETLSNAKALLKMNGWLVANELTEHSLVSHLTFGLLKGWWLYEDEALRVPGSPLLSRNKWRAVLQAEGFRSVTFPVSSESARGQQIIVAESDGIIRQAQEKIPEQSVLKPTVPPPAVIEGTAPATNVADNNAAAVTTNHAVVTNQMIVEYVRSSLLEELAKALKIEEKKIDCDEALANYGVDSILAIQTVDILNERLGLSLTTTSLFDYSSITKLTTYIVTQYGKRIAERLRQPVSVMKAGAASVSNMNEAPAAAAPSAGAPRRTGPRSMALAALKNAPKEELRKEPAAPANTYAVSPGAISIVKDTSSGRDSSSRRDPIAIIGMSGRFAKADDLDELWEYLASGTDLTEDVSRWNIAHVPELTAGTNGVRLRGGFLRQIDCFDPLFFSISGIEANYMDPQHRIFLEEAWKALENAGYAGTSIEGRRCGVYAGHNGSDYSRLISGPVPALAMWGNVASILSARIAYFLNLQGPAITVDTACSSSLVATHLACQALWSREIDFALAGGVFVQCTPGFFISSKRAGLLSSDGCCHTFDWRASGMVPGEGAGVVALKRLEEAVADGDHIYGVIRGSGINQDGATSGITAPSALAQERLENEVYNTFDIQPENIQMVEAHGTGTKLGDPIEFQALTNAFRKSTDKKGFCAIGSIKTNIGHATAASGIAGLIKLALSLSHAQIPPSLHYEKGNPQIDFENSPFYVNTGLRDWTVPPGRRRVAAVSSFGLSGTNSHMVVEEAPAVETESPNSPAYLIVLSAQTAVQLRRQVERLLAHCECQSKNSCGNMSYTLLLGRKHLPHRFAAIVSSVEELVTSLRNWLAKGKALKVYTGELTQRDHPHQESLIRYGNEMICKTQGTTDPRQYLEALGTIAEMFVQGYQLEFSTLFANHNYHRVPLPTYPFAREQYWIPNQSPGQLPLREAGGRLSSLAAQAPTVLHPLVHERMPGSAEHIYRSTFTGEEFFLGDHIVQGTRILPAMAYLEMALAALNYAYPGRNRQLCLRHIAFVRPLTVANSSAEIHIRLSNEDAEETKFIISAAENDEVVHCTGRAVVHAASDRPRLDLTALNERCTNSWPGSECYARFDKTGLTYGPAHRGVQRLAAGRDAEGNPFVLAEIQLPAAIRSSRSDFVLHPSVLDSALQASAGFGLQLNIQSPLLLPFAVEQVEIFAPTPAEAVACVRERSGGGVGASTRTFELEVCEADGRLCVRLSGVTARAPAESPEAGALLLSAPRWETQITELPAGSAADSGTKRSVLLYAATHLPQASLFRMCAELLGKEQPQLACQVITPDSLRLEESFAAMARDLLPRVQEFLRSNSAPIVRCQVVVPAEGAGWLFAAISGLLKTAHNEDPKFYGQVIGIPNGTSVDHLVEILRQESYGSAELVRYEEDRRLVRIFREVIQTEDAVIPWQSGGVYLITGGAGGLGRIFAREIASQATGSTVVLVGRSELDAAQQAELKSMQDAGAAAEYHRIDVTSRFEVEGLITSVLARLGRINGVLHCAGLLQDSFLLKKTTEQLNAVLGPKVAGTINLDELTQNLPLDFFVTFSSASSIFGSVGQADYAMANAFLDCYASYRAALVAEGKRSGTSVVFNWPWWSAGGMQLGASSMAAMSRRGMKPLTTEAGIRAFYRGLSSRESQVVVLTGHAERLKALLETQPSPEKSVISVETVGGEELCAFDLQEAHARTTHYLKQKFASVLALPVDRLDADAPLEQYGIDSVLVLDITSELEQTFGSLSKTLLFEHQTIDALAGYFLQKHQDKLQMVLGLKATAVPAANVPAPAAQPQKQPDLPPQTISPPRIASRPEPAVPRTAEPGASDIAIIGISGRYPQARDVWQYWQNLREGRNCVTEIPPDRWDYHRYFDPEKGKTGKTYTKWGGFIEGVDEFDPLFFNLSPRNAEAIDPQERLFLQTTYEAIEDAGYTRTRLQQCKQSGIQGNVGVFVGVMYGEYQYLGIQEQMLGNPRAVVSSPASVANRVSYFLNLHGPSLAVDTMCSSSLTALHLACKSLEQGECEMALAGGVNVSIHPNKYFILAQGQFASSVGLCKSFGIDADGYVPAEGVGAVLLKPLARAVADGDHIYAVIKGSAINHGGKTNGYTVPNPVAQTQAIMRALKTSGVPARAITYLEAHGAGTSLGDPIEIAALTEAFQTQTAERQFCAIGSTKSTIGHAEGAAGIAGVTKVVMQMRHGMLVPSLHSEQLNPYIDFASTPFFVQRALVPWERPRITIGGTTREFPRTAGVSSFGAGGANAHVVLEEYIPPVRATVLPGASQPETIIVLSAKSAAQLQQQTRNLFAAIKDQGTPDDELPGMAYTLQIGSEAFEHRLAILASSISQLQNKLERLLAGEEGIEGVYAGETKREKDVLALFTADEELQDALGKWIQRKKYAKLADLWVKGLTIDWSRLYSGHYPVPVSLPTYPFLREKYWITLTAGRPAHVPEPTKTAVAATPHGSSVSGTASVLTKQWQRSSLENTFSSERRALIISNFETRTLAGALALRLPGSEILDLDSTELPAIDQIQWSRYNSWIDLIGCGETKHYEHRWLPYLQHWIEQSARDGRTALCVTRGLERYLNPQVNLSGASRAGLYRMLQNEYRQLHSRHVDSDTAIEDSVLLDQIVSELAAETLDGEICYRGGERYRAVLQVMPGSDSWLAEKDVSKPFAPDEVLLITGGTRGIGFECAKHFVRRYGVKRLVLMGRDVFPPREEWVDYQKQQHSLAKKVAAILALATEGVQIKVSAAPLGDETILHQEIKAISASLGPIRGVLHCAGVADTQTPAFIRKNPAGIQRVWEPKVTGLDNLLRCIEYEPLRFIVLFSSVSAVIPKLAVGHSDYASANAYMDYVAAAYAPTLPIVSVHWGSWKESGAGELKSRVYRDLGLLAQTNSEGLHFLDRILARPGEPTLMPVMVDAQRWKPHLLLQREAEKDATGAVTLVSVPDHHGEQGTGVLEDTQNWLRSFIAGQLKLDPLRLDLDTPLLNYGVDSVLLAQLVRPVGDRIGKVLDPSLFFQYPTVSSFARWLVKEFGVELTAIARPAAAPAPEPSESQVIESTKAWLRSLIASQLKLDPVRLDLDTPLLNYGVDSVMLAQLVRPVGERVDAVLDPSLFFQYPTVSSFARWLAKEHGSALRGLRPTAVEEVAVGTNSNNNDEAPSTFSTEPQPVPSRTSPEIAVVGLSCQFPGANNLEEYWQLLREGRNAIARPPAKRGFPRECFAGLLDNVTHFDPTFFLVPTADAKVMDPQALLLLEESIHTLHHAGYSQAEIRGARVGVYVGARSRSGSARTVPADHPVAALAPNYLAANISRFLDVRGPSLVVDTACSSALVAMQIAIQSLLSGDIAAALVGSASVLDATALQFFDRRGILSKTPQFHLFDRRAGGAVLSEGAGMVMLKRVDQAERDGDSIYAVVRGVAVNNDGRTASATAPNLQAQKEVMQEALEKAGVRPEQVSHIEVSGSGSEITDLLELKALEAIYRPEKGLCDLGSMKPNIGHPLSAAGMASFIKVVLMLHRRHLVPFLSGQEPMQHFNFEKSPFVFNRIAKLWEDVHFAAISSFADGGTNAHVILAPWQRTASKRIVRHPLPPPALQRIDLTSEHSSMGAEEVADTVVQEFRSSPNFWVRVGPPLVYK